MIKHEVKKFVKFVSFAITIWILCLAYAVTSIGD